MKNLLKFYYILTILLINATLNAFVPVYSEIVIDADTDEVLHTLNADTKTQPASLAKMMTLYIAFREISTGKLNPCDNITFSQNAVNQAPSKLGVKKGHTISVREAIMALITKSANDVAVALAEKIAGSVPKFVNLMQFHASRLNMCNTKFTNPSGYKDSKQYTTARDMVKLSKALLCNYKQYYVLFSAKDFKYKGNKLTNNNSVLGKHNGNIVVDGIKTGYVAASGYNLSASAVNPRGERIIAIVMGSPSKEKRALNMKNLISIGFQKKKSAKTPLPKKKNRKKRKFIDVTTLG